MGDVVLPNMPDVSGDTINKDPNLRDLLIAIKQTLEKLTGTDPQSNTSLVDYLNDNQ